MNKAQQGSLPIGQSPKSNKSRQAEFKARKSAGGIFTRGDVWAHPGDWPLLRELEQRLREAREAREQAPQATQERLSAIEGALLSPGKFNRTEYKSR